MVNFSIGRNGRLLLPPRRCGCFSGFSCICTATAACTRAYIFVTELLVHPTTIDLRISTLVIRGPTLVVTSTIDVLISTFASRDPILGFR